MSFVSHHLWLVLAIVVVIAVVGYVAYCYGTISTAITVGERIAAQAIPFEQHPSNPSAYILVMGDSTAVGTGAATNTESIAGRLGALYPNADVTNISENGLKFGGLVGKLPLVPRAHYDLIVLQIGANDVTARVPLASTSVAMETVLSFASAHADHVIAFSSGNIGGSPVFHWPLTWYFTQRALNMRALYMRESLEFPNVQYIDFFKSFADEPFNKNIPLYYAEDRFHPSGAGYGVWFQTIKQYLPTLPGEASSTAS